MTRAEKYLPGMAPEQHPDRKVKNAKKTNGNGYEPPNLGRAIRLPVPDFSDPNRPKTCLEVDFPIAPINALANLEGNAGKPIYQMSKWWARRRSSVFRSLLIAAATQAPDDPTEAAKLVWDHYYANHQKAGSFKHLKVLEPFMGGGTTLVEGSRLGFQLTGIDLNPVAWFVCKNELACSDPDAVRALFDHIEAEIKPRVQPFFSTSCPRGHAGRWIDKTKLEYGDGQEHIPTAALMPEDFDPLDLPPDQRTPYKWRGPEVIYTFWAKHGPCQASGCNHRTPVFKSPVVAVKEISTKYLDLACPSCGLGFHAELGESRMAPGADRVVLDGEHPFTELSQPFAKLLADYDKGNAQATIDRLNALEKVVDREPGLHCPACGTFAGKNVKDVLLKHSRAKTAGARKKKDFGIKPKGNSSKKVSLHLLIHPDWLAGSPGEIEDAELGGWAGAEPDDTARWFAERRKGLALVEVRGAELPAKLTLPDGTVMDTANGTSPKQAHVTCSSCGRQQNILESVRPTGHTAPVAAYALQCHCPQCDAEGYNYNGRYFKAPDAEDLDRLIRAEREWAERKEADLAGYWPTQPCWDAYMMRANGGVNEGWGYTHWWKMFNPRQLLVHTQLLRCIMDAEPERWSLDVREQAVGAALQYLRMMCMFSFWHLTYDKLAPALSNANFHPKHLVVETNVYGALGYGRVSSCSSTVANALEWANDPWELALPDGKSKGASEKVQPGDPVGSITEYIAGSSTDLREVELENGSLDLIITDPPFGNNLFYADLADFFYVWLRIPLLKWYEGQAERAYFEPERTPHAMEAVDNSVEHPDDREDWEKHTHIPAKHLERIRQITGDDDLQETEPNPLYRKQPSSDFYCSTLTACWAESNRVLKPGGLLAFTFHHSEDAPWVDVLESLFEAGFILVAAFPILGDETKGEKGAFGSRKIEYDIVHVCRKRLEPPQPVSWARMRRWVRAEAQHLRDLLELAHGKDLPEPDLRVILRGKALEFFSRHYGEVYTGDNVLLGVNEALLGINQLLDDLLSSGDGGRRPPEQAEPGSRLFLRIFQGRREIARDELHKTLRGTGVSQPDLEGRGWIKVIGKQVHVVPVEERFAYFTAPGRNRRALKTDLDQAVFLTGAAMGDGRVNINVELDSPTWVVKKSADAILAWMAEMAPDPKVQDAAKTALDLVSHWRNKPKTRRPEQLTLFEQLEEEAET